VDNGDVYDFMLFFQSFNLLQENLMSVTKMAGKYTLLIIFLNQDYTEEDEEDEINTVF
jgi:hypothetical protein